MNDRRRLYHDRAASDPRSFTYEYVVLDRSATDDPVWVLAHALEIRAAGLDSVGSPTVLDQLDMLEWATMRLLKVVNPRPVPGGGFTYRLEEGEEEPQ